MKNSFVIYHSYKKHFKFLTNEQKGILFDAFIEYSENQTIPELEPVLMMAFNFVAEDIDINRQKWEDMAEARSEAGKKGAAARWGDNKDMAKDSKRILPMAKNGKHAVNVSVNGSVNVSDSDSVTSYNKKSVSCLSNPILYEKLSTQLGVSTKYAHEQCVRMEDWLKSKGKTQKDYEAFARNWIRRSMDGKEEVVEKQRPTL